MPTVNKLLLHTTESSSWPSYPTFAPTLTYNPWVRKWRQHYPINQAALTLKNAGTYKTNRANVCQVEIVAYCDPVKLSSPAHISKISDAAYGDLAELFYWLSVEWDVPLINYPKWKPYPESYGDSNGVRMTANQFTTFRGLCGHQHAPGNVHGDPGLLKVGLILGKAKELEGDDVALSDADIAKIAKAVWNSGAVDMFTPPPGKETASNPLWKAQSELEWLVENVDAIRKAVEKV